MQGEVLQLRLREFLFWPESNQEFYAGQYAGFCARSCFYCGPTATPTLIPPTPAPTTLLPTTSQVPTAICNDGFLQRDAKDFLRNDLGWSELCKSSTSSTTCCRYLQQAGRCESNLGSAGSLFGYCANTCGYCGFEDYAFQNINSHLLDSRLVLLAPRLHFLRIIPPCRHVSIDADDIIKKISILSFCGAYQRRMPVSEK